MTGVVLGKPNAETLSAPQFKDLLGALIQAGYVQLDQLKAGSDEMVKSDLTCDSRTDEEEGLIAQWEGQGLYSAFQSIVFTTLEEVAAHYEKYPIFTINFEQDLYDWTTIEGDYGYKLVLDPAHPARVLQELVIDAANEGNDLIGWEDAPMAEVMYFSVCPYGLFIDVQCCPPDMDKTIPEQPRYAQIRTLLTSVLGVEPQIYTLDVA